MILQAKTEISNGNLAEISHRTPLQEEDESPTLEVFQNPAEQCPEQPALCDPALSKGLGLDNVQWFIPASAIL